VRRLHSIEANGVAESVALEGEVRRLLLSYKSKSKSLYRAAVRRASELLAVASGESITVLQIVITTCAKGSKCNDALVREASCELMAGCLEVAYSQDLDVDETSWNFVVESACAQLFDSSQGCRIAACRAIGRCQDNVSRSALRQCLETEPSKAVRLAAIEALEPATDQDTLALLERTRDIESEVRQAAWNALRTKRVPPNFQMSAPYLASGLNASNFTAVCLCLAYWCPSDLSDLVSACGNPFDEKFHVIIYAARGLARLRDSNKSFDDDYEELRRRLLGFDHLKLNAPSLRTESGALAALLAARADLIQPYQGLPRAAAQDDEALEALAAHFDDDDCLDRASAVEMAALLAPKVFDEGRRRRIAELIKTRIMTHVSLEYADAALRLLDALSESDLAASGLVWTVARQGRLLCKSLHPEREHAMMLAGVGHADADIRRIALIGLGRAAAKHGGTRPGVFSLFQQVTHNSLEVSQVREAAARAASDALLAANSIQKDQLFTPLLFNQVENEQEYVIKNLREIAAQTLAKLAWRFRAVSNDVVADMVADLLLANCGGLTELLFENLRAQAPETLRACAERLGSRFCQHSNLTTTSFESALNKLQELDEEHLLPGLAFIAVYESLALLLSSDEHEPRLRAALGVIPVFEQREANGILARLATKCGISKLAAKAKRAGDKHYHSNYDPRGLVDIENIHSDQESEQPRNKPRRTTRASVSYREETNDEKYFAELRRKQKSAKSETRKPSDDTICSICGSGDLADTLLLCDGPNCKNGTHMACLNPPLDEIPQGDWFCASCTAAASAEDSPKSSKIDDHEEDSLFSHEDEEDEASI